VKAVTSELTGHAYFEKLQHIDFIETTIDFAKPVAN
jgi:hypothetical protein